MAVMSLITKAPQAGIVEASLLTSDAARVPCMEKPIGNILLT
jgi:hypothetical protein